MKHLMVVGDDLGMSRAVNAGVRYAFDRGILTHASVLVNSPLLEETAALVRRHPPITCGIHLTLTWGLPVSSPGTIPTLTDSRGRFLTLSRFLTRYVFGAINLTEVEREWTAQFQVFLRVFGTPASVSTHHHVHLLLHLYMLAQRLAAQFRVPWLRPPQEIVHPGRRTLSLTSRISDTLSREGLKSVSLLLAGHWSRAQGRTTSLLHSAGAVIRLRRLAGLDTAESLRRLLFCLPGGQFELVCHPVLPSVGDSAYKQHTEELAALCRPGLQTLCSRLGIVLWSPGVELSSNEHLQSEAPDIRRSVVPCAYS